MRRLRCVKEDALLTVPLDQPVQGVLVYLMVDVVTESEGRT